MSIRQNGTVMPGGYIPNQKDSINRLIHEVRELKRAIAALDINVTSTITNPTSGLAQETTLQDVETNTATLDTLLTQIETNTDNLEALLTQIEVNTAASGTVYTTNSGVVDANTLRITLEDVQRDAVLDNETNTANIANNTASIDTQLAALDRNGGAVTSETLRVVFENEARNNLDDINGNTLGTEDQLKRHNWDKIPGNSIEYTWIDGTLPNSRLIQTIVYKTGPTTHITQTYAYNANDEVISITTT